MVLWIDCSLFTQTMKKYYVGIKPGAIRELFRSAIHPTDTSHGHLYNAAVGPFVTKAGAEYMRDHGNNNPHCQTVWQAEKLARQQKSRQQDFQRLAIG